MCVAKTFLAQMASGAKTSVFNKPIALPCSPDQWRADGGRHILQGPTAPAPREGFALPPNVDLSSMGLKELKNMALNHGVSPNGNKAHKNTWIAALSAHFKSLLSTKQAPSSAPADEVTS